VFERQSNRAHRQFQWFLAKTGSFLGGDKLLYNQLVGCNQLLRKRFIS
jgi:hypothetical protein